MPALKSGHLLMSFFAEFQAGITTVAGTILPLAHVPAVSADMRCCRPAEACHVCRTTGQPGSAAVAAPPASSPQQPGQFGGQYGDWVMKNMTRAVAGASLGIWVRFSGCLAKQLVSLLSSIF